MLPGCFLSVDFTLVWKPSMKTTGMCGEGSQINIKNKGYKTM